MLIEPNQIDIDRAFQNTNFGPASETPDGRKLLVADCVVKRACGFSSGGTIEAICKELGMLTKKGSPRLHAKRWAYCHMHMPRQPCP